MTEGAKILVVDDENAICELCARSLHRYGYEVVSTTSPLQAVEMMRKQEFDLLLFLLEHANRVFSKDELVERIWGMDALGDASTVTVHIARIREKIEENPSKPQYIGTVWGSGYRFIV